MREAPMGGGGLSGLDADFLDSMLGLSEQVSALCAKYIKDSDASSNAGVVDMARSMLEQVGYQGQMLREVRGHADGDKLRQQEHEENVEVEASY